MSGYGQVSAVAKIRSANQIRRVKMVRKMKLGLRQRIRNWLMREEIEEDVPQLVEADRLSSEGMRLQIYRASGGYVVETRNYDSHKDRHHHTMHVITDEQDLGDSLGKIVMMEALKR